MGRPDPKPRNDSRLPSQAPGTSMYAQLGIGTRGCKVGLALAVAFILVLTLAGGSGNPPATNLASSSPFSRLYSQPRPPLRKVDSSDQLLPAVRSDHDPYALSTGSGALRRPRARSALLSSSMSSDARQRSGGSTIKTAAQDAATPGAGPELGARNTYPSQSSRLQVGLRTDRGIQSPTVMPRDDPPTVLILTPVKNAVTHLDRFFRNIRGLDYPFGRISLGILESDSDDKRSNVESLWHPGHRMSSWERLQWELPSLQADFRRVGVWKHDFHYNLTRGRRHELTVQTDRRQVLAKSRNYLLSKALQDEEYVLWVDSDVTTLPSDLLWRLLSSSKQIVTAHVVHRAGGDTYDLNSWATREGYENIARDVDSVPQDVVLFEGLTDSDRLFHVYMEELRSDNPSDVVKLNAVGGAALLVDADLHREGLIFPPFVYKHRLETEAFALAAQAMGVQVYGMPNVEVVHKDTLL